jgi:hypothetical protein
MKARQKMKAVRQVAGVSRHRVHSREPQTFEPALLSLLGVRDWDRRDHRIDLCGALGSLGRDVVHRQSIDEFRRPGFIGVNSSEDRKILMATCGGAIENIIGRVEAAIAPTVTNWFACARLFRPCLREILSRRFRNAHHHGFCPQQLAVA